MGCMRFALFYEIFGLGYKQARHDSIEMAADGLGAPIKLFGEVNLATAGY